VWFACGAVTRFVENAMLVSEILRIKGNVLFTTTPDAPVLDAVRVMAQHDIGSLIVMDHGRMAGLVTFCRGSGGTGHS
jgi:CBS domain-containing protein